MDIEKTIKKYGQYYRIALIEGDFTDIDKKMESFRKRLSEMYLSENFRIHDIYPTTNNTYVYAVIAMCLELKALGYSDKDIIEILDRGFEKRRKFFKLIIAFVNKLPNSFNIARKWNINDHAKRVEDGSITYDYFTVTKDKVEYSISKCMYVEMFEHYARSSARQMSSRTQG